METDYFCVERMIKMECNLKHEIPILQMLSHAYEIFKNGKGGVRLLSQILVFYTYFYNGEEQEKILHYFKLFMDQPFDNAYKYRHLIVSLFN